MSRSPSMTVANLVDYALTSSAARRRAIIEQYHDPKVFKLNWHGATDAIFAGRVRNAAEVDEFSDSEKARLQKQLTGDPKSDRQAVHILEMIELLETSDLQRIASGARIESHTVVDPDFTLGALTVRVRPHLVLSRSKIGKRYPEYGAVKCHNLSSNKLDENSAKLFATVVQMHCESCLSGNDVQPDLCRVYDLYADTLTVAPKNQKRLRRQLEDSAQEICDRWTIIGTRLAQRREDRRKAS